MVLKILNININGLKGHLDTLIDRILDCKPEIFHIQETKLGIKDVFELKIHDYKVIDHRRNSKYGGVMTCYKQNLDISKIIKNTSPKGNEYITLVLNNPTKTRITNLYNPTSKNIDIHLTNNNLKKNIHKCNIITGDLNSKHPDWGSTKTNKGGTLLNDCIKNKMFNHSIHKKPTHYHYVKTHKPDVLDIALWNDFGQIEKVTVKNLKNAGCDHLPILFKFHLDKSDALVNITSKIKQYNKVNWDTMNNSLASKLKLISNTNELETLILNIEKEINNIYQEIPTKNVHRTNHGITEDTRKLIKKNRKLYNLY